jgi:glycosyltransferase involved in cell wall biosynthesis
MLTSIKLNRMINDKKNEIKISIITVVYNGVDALESTILSVINQSYKNIEYLIIDGGSTDGTVEIIKKYKDKIKYWISESDKGIYDAMNKGWSKAKNDSFILFLGAGDKIIKLPNMSIHEKSDVIYGDVTLGDKKIFRSTVGWRTYFGNTIHHQAMLIRKRIHLEPPFSLSYKVYGDFDFNQRLLKKRVKFNKDKDFYSFALEGGVSEQINIKEVQQVVRKNYGFLVSLLALLYFKLQKINESRKNNCSISSL